MITPDINYTFWAKKWNDINVQFAYTDKNIALYSNFKGNYEEIESEIIKITELPFEKLTDDLILKCIDLINQWGGKESRYFYIKRKNLNFLSFRDIVNLDYYKHAIQLSKENNVMAFDCFGMIKGIGTSFKGKHAMFWSNYELPVIDSKIVGCLGYKSTGEFEHYHSYVDYCVILKTIQSKLNLTLKIHEIEKAIFAFHRNYFKNDNSGFTNKIECKIDLDFAIIIANKLGINIPLSL